MTKSSHRASAAVKNISGRNRCGVALNLSDSADIAVLLRDTAALRSWIGENDEGIGSTIGRDQSLAVRQQPTGSIHEARRDGSYRQ
jgi:hypothetical protein